MCERVEIPEADEGVECRLVDGFPAYAVGNDGSLWSRKNNRWGMSSKWTRMTGTPLRSGHLVVSISGPSGKRHPCIHQIVLETFVGPCPPGLECRHMNGKPADNRVTNLKWGTRLENQHDRYRHGTDQFGERNHRAKLTADDVVKIRELYATGSYLHKEIAAMFGVTRKAVCFITMGKRWAQVGGPITDGNDRKFRFDSETGRRCRTKGAKANA